MNSDVRLFDTPRKIGEHEGEGELLKRLISASEWIDKVATVLGRRARGIGWKYTIQELFKGPLKIKASFRRY